jgi:hypothetical protein
MLSQLVPFYVIGGLLAVAVFLAALAAEGRGSHILRIFLSRDRREAIDALREEALSGDVPREPNDLNLVSQLGAAERKYAEIDARRARQEAHSTSAS